MRRLFILTILFLNWSNAALAQNSGPVVCGNSRWNGAQFSAAELSRLERELDSDKEQLNSSDPRLAMSMIKSSYALFANRKAESAEPLFLSGLAQLQQNRGVPDGDMAQTLVYMAELAICRQAMELAEKYYVQAIKIAEQLPLAKRNALAYCLLNFAGMLYQQGRFVEAEAIFARSEKVRVELGGKPLAREARQVDPQVVELTKKGNIAAARVQAQAVLEKAEASLQAKSGQLEEITAKLTKITESKSVDWADTPEATAARKLIGDLQQQVRVAQTDFHASQVALGQALHVQAELLHSQKQYAQAEALYLRALEMIQDVGGARQSSGGRVLSGLGQLYRAQGQYEQAQSHQSRALEVLMPLLGQAHPDVQECEAELAFLRGQLAGGNPVKK